MYIGSKEELRYFIEQCSREMPEWAKKRASAFNAILRYRLEQAGCDCRDEVIVPNRGDGRRGKVDIIVDAPQAIAIEVDRRSPRKKSLHKLTWFKNYESMVILRDPK